MKRVGNISRKRFNIPVVVIVIITLALGSAHFAYSEHRPGGGSGQIVPLNGEWQFYWKKLLQPGETDAAEAEYIKVPSSWDHFGYGTYRHVFEVSEEDIGKSKALYLQLVGSAYRIWINGEEKNGMGVVGRSAAEEVSRLHKNVVFFVPTERTVEIVMQVSNYSFREGGIFQEIKFGDAEAVSSYVSKKYIHQIMAFSGFLVLGLFYCLLYGMRKEFLSYLYIGLFLIAIAVRTFFLHEFLPASLIFVDDWKLATKIEYLAEIAAFAFIVLLLRSIYPQDTPRWLVRSSLVTAALIAVYVLISSTRVHTSTLEYHSALLAIFLLSFAVYVGIRALKHKRQGAWIHLAAVAVLIAVLVNDAMYYTSRLPTVEISHFGFFVFILLEGINVLRNSRSWLEEQVNARTRELFVKNEELAQANLARAEMFASIAQELGAPVSSLKVNLKHMLDSKDKPEPLTMLPLLGKVAYIERLVNDLFELSRLELGNVKMQLETVAVKDFIDDMFRRFKNEMEFFMIDFKLERVESERNGQPLHLRIDTARIARVLDSLMFTAREWASIGSGSIAWRGRVIDESENKPPHFLFELEVAGLALPEEELYHVFERFFKTREGQTEGAGLGLVIAKAIVELHDGHIGVKSVPETGTVLYFSLPVAA